MADASGMLGHEVGSPLLYALTPKLYRLSSWRFRDLSDGGDVGLGNGCGARAAEFGLSLVLCCCVLPLERALACAAIDATPSCGEDDPTDGEGSAVASLEDDAGLGLRSHRIIMRKAGDGATGCSTPQIIVAQHKVTLSDMDSSSSETSLSRFREIVPPVFWFAV